MNINEKNVSLVTNNLKKIGCLPRKMLISEHSFVLKMTKIETIVMHGYIAVFLVVNNANALKPCIFMMNIFNVTYQ